MVFVVRARISPHFRAHASENSDKLVQAPLPILRLRREKGAYLHISSGGGCELVEDGEIVAAEERKRHFTVRRTDQATYGVAAFGGLEDQVLRQRVHATGVGHCSA